MLYNAFFVSFRAKTQKCGAKLHILFEVTKFFADFLYR